MRPRFEFDHAGRIRPEHADAFYRYYPELAPGYEGDGESHCTACGGSGEGAYDGTICGSCGGEGALYDNDQGKP